MQISPPSKIKYFLGSVISLFTVWKSYFTNLTMPKDNNHFHPNKITHQKEISTAGSLSVNVLRDCIDKNFGKMPINHVLFSALIRSLEIYYKKKVYFFNSLKKIKLNFIIKNKKAW